MKPTTEPQLATILFDSPDAMIRVDASEYSEKHSISRLIGSPPGYVGYDAGGQLTEYVRRKPYCIVLIDEIEKACREFVTLFLQVLDDGRLTDGQGRVVDMRNTVIMMTSNLGAVYLNAVPEGRVSAQTKANVMNAIQSHFPPEFVNRIDDVVIFVSRYMFLIFKIGLIMIISVPYHERICSKLSISVLRKWTTASLIEKSNLILIRIPKTTSSPSVTPLHTELGRSIAPSKASYCTHSLCSSFPGVCWKMRWYE